MSSNRKTRICNIDIEIMETPKKIYVEIRPPFGNEFTEMIGFANMGNAEDAGYVRKDVLLDWAKEREKETREKAGMNDAACAYHDAIMDLIEKLNSI